MDSPLKRTSTNVSEDSQNEGASLTAVQSISSLASSSRINAPGRLSARSPSGHSLLGTNAGDVRRALNAETSKSPIVRASISMPPPSTKPSAERRLSASLNFQTSNRKSEEISTSPPSSVKSFDDRYPLGSATFPQHSTTATDGTRVITNSTQQSPGLPVLSPPLLQQTPNQLNLVSIQSSHIVGNLSVPRSDPGMNQTMPAGQSLATSSRTDLSDSALPQRAPRTAAPRSISSSRRFSSTTPRSDGSQSTSRRSLGIIGVCALDVKARSRPSRQILTRLQGDGEFEVVVFGDKAILDEAVENWPICDFLISFFSNGFPLDKAIAYVKLRKPFVVNDLMMQKVLWDRRICLKILDQMHVPTPRRLEVNRDGGPTFESNELAQHVKRLTGVVLDGPEDGTGGGSPITHKVSMSDDSDTLIIDGKHIRKPFVEKPVDGEDHNIIIYFPKNHEGGGARRLFRKIGNKSSEYDPALVTPRCITDNNSSFIYEQFLKTENAEDVKAYTVGPDYCHAETRKSPVVDGLVKRNTHGKELRYVTNLNEFEKEMASRVARAFGQRICGFDLLRTGSQSFVIDVNGWSFVKDNEDYYNDCANILRSMFSAEKFKADSASIDDQASDTGPDGLSRSRQHTGQFHRTALKTILKSPSINRLSQHISSKHGMHGPTSPKVVNMTTPLSSPPSVERLAGVVYPGSAAIETADFLPPSMLPSADPSQSAMDESSSIADKETPAPMPHSKHSWKLKGVVTVIRHADRTPKQKLKFTAHSDVFVDLLKGHNDEVLLKGEAALASVDAAAKTAQLENLEDQDKLRNLRNALAKKGGQPGTKVQIKPMFRKRKPEESSPPSSDSRLIAQTEQTIPEHEEAVSTPNMSPVMERQGSVSNSVHRITTRSDSISGVTFSRFAAAENDLILDKLQLVLKWGGEPTHSARYQAQDLGTNMRDDFKLLNKEVLEDVRIFTSSEKRVKTSAQIWAGAFLGRQDIPEDYIQVRKDLLDDSNAAKDVMDKVKKKLKHLLREGNSVPEEFAWPKDVAEPYIVMQTVIELLKFHRKVMRHNFKKLSNSGAADSLAAINGSNENKDGSKESGKIPVSSIQARWCTGEDAELFKERWEKLFSEFCDTEKADPSKISELYDTMKYDALHNKQFLEWVFTPSQTVLDEISRDMGVYIQGITSEPERLVEETIPGPSRQDTLNSNTNSNGSPNEKNDKYDRNERQSFAQKIGFRRKSVLAQPPSTPPLMSYEQDASYFKLYAGSGTKQSQDKRLGRLRELYRYSKILFDYVSPQEYGISDHEKLEIGLLTSLPLLREIVQDLEELQASGDAKFFAYFTKESHIYTLLNCIMEGGIHTKIKRTTIPELDYLSQICFELYEAKDAITEEAAYSIRISISPGCHTVDPLDVSLDSKHAIGSAPRRSLTNHQDWKEVLSTLKAKFNTVELPKSFLAVNVSDKHEQDAQLKAAEKEGEMERSPEQQAHETPVLPNYDNSVQKDV